jgi:hypothetical protein
MVEHAQDVVENPVVIASSSFPPLRPRTALPIIESHRLEIRLQGFPSSETCRLALSIPRVHDSDKLWYRVPTKLNRRILLCGVREPNTSSVSSWICPIVQVTRDLNNLSAPGGKLCREISGRKIGDRSLTPCNWVRYSCYFYPGPWPTAAFRLTISPLRRDAIATPRGPSWWRLRIYEGSRNVPLKYSQGFTNEWFYFVYVIQKRMIADLWQIRSSQMLERGSDSLQVRAYARIPACPRCKTCWSFDQKYEKSTKKHERSLWWSPSMNRGISCAINTGSRSDSERMGSRTMLSITTKARLCCKHRLSRTQCRHSGDGHHQILTSEEGPQNLINESITLVEECEKSFYISQSSRLNLGYTSSGKLTSVLLATVVHPTSNVKIHCNIS